MRKNASANRSARGSRGQIAMWMLTKMSMLFFILMLAFLMTNLSGTFRDALCNDQARLQAQRLASGINDVVNSPLEDERKVLPMEAVLSAGRSDFERYTINLTSIPDSVDQIPSLTGGGITDVYTGQIIVTVDTEGECHGAGRAPYQNFTLHLFPPGDVVQADPIYRGFLPDLAQTLVLTPSKIDRRTQYLVILKCSRKEYPPVNQLYLEACYTEDPDTCIKFDILADDGTSPACNPNPPIPTP